MAIPQNQLLHTTRRHFFSRCGIGVGGMALASLMGEGRSLATESPYVDSSLVPRKPHFEPKAKNIIYLFMAGGPSQLELFEYKPKLQQLDGQPPPEYLIKGKRFAFMDRLFKSPIRLLGTRRKFKQYGESKRYVSECLPHLATVVDDLAFLHTLVADNFNHAPAKIFANTGSTRFGHPSMGAWVTYGLGSESQDLPAFIVLQSGPRGPRGGTLNWGSGFMPTNYQGIPFRSDGEPVLNLSSPRGFTPEQQGRTIDTIRELNLAHLVDTNDPEIATRIASYEMAYRMQTSAPELIDFHTETKETLDLYGAKPGNASFANNCLLARRLVERGVRFVQLYHTDWDHHGNPGSTLNEPLDKVCKEIDQPCAALITDLKRRGLLDQTLVMWGGEFGRTPLAEPLQSIGRNHHIDAATMWFAGGGIQRGQAVGETDEFGFGAVEDRVHMHDLHATVLHVLGLDHTKLTYRFQGRHFRLTDIAGNVVEKLIA